MYTTYCTRLNQSINQYIIANQSITHSRLTNTLETGV